MRRGFAVHGVCAEELSPTAPALVLLFGGQSSRCCGKGKGSLSVSSPYLTRVTHCDHSCFLWILVLVWRQKVLASPGRAALGRGRGWSPRLLLS